jgi:formylglycine-generating enzyme required for sulfatase activity
VRGGSWSYRRSKARCAFRDWYLPVSRLDDLGFRVVLRPPPVP